MRSQSVGMRRIVLVLILLAGGAVWMSSPAAACSVTEPLPTEAQYLAQADVVFEGTAVSSRNPDPAGPPVLIAWTFAVDRPIKGSVGPQQEVQTALSGSACGFTFTAGTRYRVYANQSSGVLSTGWPQGTREAALVATTTTVARPPTTAAPARPSSPRRIALTG